ncbi:MAG: oligopeptide ABC transporter substrate-binding protein OppA [Paracoccus denitrificans]|nr:MAG: oligopeptide ABC transporter substrate-binding protein OppA [Paracoccus denitrificans]PZO83596.1 MAG: oligopeptide ABC transporter substrate-binding protein OppA [Paracoccus denitrificans]
MTKLFLTTALVAALASPALAAKPAEGEKLADKQELNFWVLDAFKTLDPGKNTDRSGSDLLRQIFEGLMIEDAKGAMIPGVAESYTESDDKKTYTFKLRDAKWSNGDPVTAGDFVFAWRRVADPATASEYAWFIELMNVENAGAVVKGDMPPDQLGIKAIDDKTLEVKLSTPTPYFLKTLAMPTVGPVPQKVVEAEGDGWAQPGKIVGNGAYKLQSHDLGVQATVVRNENYWDNDNTILDTVRFITVNDQNAGLTRYQAGELDWMDTLPAGQFPRVKQQLPNDAVSVPDACSYAYLFNLSDKGPESLKDLRVREALSYAVDRDIIVDKVLQGGQRPAYWWTHWAVEGFEEPDVEFSKWTQAERVEKAKALLAEAGYGPDKPLKLTIQYNTSEDHKKLAVAVQQFWKAIGVDVTLANYEWKVHTDRLQNQDFEVARYAWCGDYNEPSTFLDYFRTDGYNNGKYNSPEYDKLLQDAKTAENTGPIYKAADEQLIKDMALVPVYHYAKAMVIKPTLKGVPLENVMNDWYAKDLYRIAE